MVLYCATTVEEGSMFRKICKDMKMQILLTMRDTQTALRQLKND